MADRSTKPEAVLLQRLSFEMQPDRVQELAYDLKRVTYVDPPPEDVAYHETVPQFDYLVFGISVGKVTVALADGKKMVLTDVLDIDWEHQAGDTISRVAASVDSRGNNHPPLDVSESEDGGEMFRHYRPHHPRAQLLLNCFLADLVSLSDIVEGVLGSNRFF